MLPPYAQTNMAAVEVPVYTEAVNEATFASAIYSKRKPVVLKNLEFGDARQLWTPNYLQEAIGSASVKVHVSPVPEMDFLKKNFQYKTMPFDSFIKRACKDLQTEYFLSPVEKYYLRSIGTGNPRKDIADIRKDFPAIAQDIKIPSFVSENKFFSSVLRIGSANMQLWTHYDVMDNILIQVIGRKRVVFFSPQDALNLYLNGDKSEVVDIDNPDFERYPKFRNAVKYECLLEPGDAVFIPALWFHNVIAQEFSVGVNIFWRHLDEDMYDKKDIYGNKDPLPACRVGQMVDKGIKILEELPDEYRDFYARIMISKLENKCLLDVNSPKR